MGGAVAAAGRSWAGPGRGSAVAWQGCKGWAHLQSISRVPQEIWSRAPYWLA